MGPSHGRPDVRDIDRRQDLGRKEEAEAGGNGGVGEVTGPPAAEFFRDGSDGGGHIEALVLEGVPKGKTLIVEANFHLENEEQGGIGGKQINEVLRIIYTSRSICQ